MDASKTFRYGQYDLLCSAKGVDNGKFRSVVVVSGQVWPKRPREIAVRRDNHATAETAIDAAYTQGVEWILNHG